MVIGYHLRDIFYSLEAVGPRLRHIDNVVVGLH